MDVAFSNAVRADSARTVCLGVRLQPLTVGHLFLLLEHENAYPDRSDEAGFADVVDAVTVCWQPHKRSRQLLNSPFAGAFLLLWGFFVRKRPLKKEKAIFDCYLREHLPVPQPDKTPPHVGGENSVPLCWRLATLLMADFGLSWEEAIDTPVARALVLWATDADRRGTHKLATERQIVFRRWAAEQEMERLAALTAKEGNPS